VNTIKLGKKPQRIKANANTTISINNKWLLQPLSLIQHKRKQLKQEKEPKKEKKTIPWQRTAAMKNPPNSRTCSN
jgi:hypothetical protein